MKERIDELNAQMKQAMEEISVIESFIYEQIHEKDEKIPDVVLVILKQNIRKLNILIRDCKIRLANYE
ncbi:MULTISPECIES: hypothetical protein [Bacillus]|uniref:hypothetical protein n=1 Tax=Bacillus TaxID=1386 RepID=UPI003019975D